MAARLNYFLQIIRASHGCTSRLYYINIKAKYQPKPKISPPLHLAKTSHATSNSITCNESFPKILDQATPQSKKKNRNIQVETLEVNNMLSIQKIKKPTFGGGRLFWNFGAGWRHSNFN